MVPRIALIGLVVASALGCDTPSPRVPPPGQRCYAPPGMPCQAPPGAAPAPYRPPGVPPAPNVGTAVTPFGVLLELPPLPQELPPLPNLGEWIQAFPWPGAPPRPYPPAQPPPPQPPPPPGPQPPGPPAAAGWHGWETEVLRLTNERRAQGASCGGRPFSPAGPLAPHPALHESARNHSYDMAARGYFDHRSPEGTGPGDRARAAGFSGGFVGENIAAGQRSPAEVVQGWMDSPGHCLNIMEPDYQHLGVGYVVSDDRYGHYWTQNFGG